MDLLPDEDNITHLAGRYYTAAMGDGTALHWYQDNTQYGNEPLLEIIYNTQTCGEYLVVRVGVDYYFLYPIEVKSLQEANSKRLGTFSKAELPRKLLQLTGDTVLRQVGPF